MRPRETVEQQIRKHETGKCQHFNGLAFGIVESLMKCCKAGVCYRSLVGGSIEGWAARVPCFGPRPDRSVNMVVPCAAYLPMTEDQIQEKIYLDVMHPAVLRERK